MAEVECVPTKIRVDIVDGNVVLIVEDATTVHEMALTPTETAGLIDMLADARAAAIGARLSESVGD